MKKVLSWMLLLAVCTGMTASCIDWGSKNPSGEIPVGVIFYTTVPGLTFFFVDEEGKDLVSLADRLSWPIASPEEMSAEQRSLAVEQCTQSPRSDGLVYYIYNDKFNAICQDYETKLWGFSTYLWGKTREPERTTYLYRPDGSLDKLQVTYEYLSSDEGTFDGVGWAVNILSVKYNGIEVFDGNETGKVFIQKPSQGDIVVKVGRL